MGTEHLVPNPAQPGNKRASAINKPGIDKDTNLENIPPENRVVVSPELGLEDMAEVISVLGAQLAFVLDTVTAVSKPEDSETVARYGQVLRALTDTEATIRGGGGKPALLGKQSPENLQHYKEQYARTASRIMTQLKNATKYMERHPDRLRHNGQMRTWVAKGYPGLATTLRGIFDSWYRLIRYEESMGMHKDRSIEIYGEVVGGRE